MFPSMTTRNRIRALRNASGLSRAGVADRLDVTERTVIRWEKGEVAIPDERKLQLAELFGGVSVPHLMGWDRSNGDGDNDGERKAA